MAQAPGTRLGVFEVVSLLGEGGMGQVYRARDTKLNRDVALKILPDAFTLDGDRIARFRREAQVLASLNHPNIAAIYGFEDSGSTHALVLELVAGPTLADRIAKGAIPLDEALPIAKQIAEALEAAHEQGIIHRDLKPANIKVREDGTVKVLDFGLAKALGSGFTSDAAGSSHSPTMATPGATQAGVMLGTVAYMAPEQARGRAAGKPADIWAFGCVLFEMLTGRSAFAGETMSDTIAKTLGQEPDWKALPASTPRRVRDVLRRCLHKEQQQRFQDIRDARVELEQAGATRGGWQRSAAFSLAAVGLMLAIVVGARWLLQKPLPPSSGHAPVTILIADFDNRTNDSTFDRTLEPVLRISLENATFISAYDRTRINSTLGVRPPDKLDERAALELAVKQGINTVLTGSIEKQGDGYLLSATATQTLTGGRIASTTGRAATKDQMIQAAAMIATTIRNALGDDTSDSIRMFSETTLSTTSLEAVRYYALAQDASSNGKFEEALRLASKTVELDQKFGVGYLLLATASQNMGRHDDAVRYINESLRHLDGMTERERLTTRGMFFKLTGDYGKCEMEYKTLSTRFQTDVIGYNQRALCLVQLRRMVEAVAEVRRAVDLLPKRTIFRINLALDEGSAGEFQMAEREARTALDQDGNRGWGLLALGRAQEGQGLLKEAADTFAQLREIDARWASEAVGALGELAMYDGRFGEASRIFAEGAEADLAGKNHDRAAGKLAVRGYLEFLRGHNQPAIAAIEKSLANSNEPGIRFTAARTLVQVGRTDRARTLMADLASETQAESRAYGKIIEANLALHSKNAREAVRLLNEANDLLDIWIGHFDLGLAYLEDGKFAQADSEFDQCIKRRGEALTLFVDSQPAFGYFPLVHYYQGRAREGLKTEGFAESYRHYLEIRAKSSEDPLLPDVRRRAGR